MNLTENQRDMLRVTHSEAILVTMLKGITNKRENGSVHVVVWLLFPSKVT